MTATRAPMRGFLLAMTVLAPLPESAASPSSGCGKTLAGGTYRMMDQGLARTYRVFVPSGYNSGTPFPLVMVFHGWGGNENEFLDDENVTALADRRGYVLVAPRGLGGAAPDSQRNSWSFRGSSTGLAGAFDDDGAPLAPGSGVGAICDPVRTPNYTYPSCKDTARNTCSWTQCQADDVAFVLALVKVVESALCVDTARVFAVGGSNGGMFTWELGQNAASAPVFRAITPLIGLPHRGYLEAPGKRGGMPVLLITGTRDTTVPPGAWEHTGHTTTGDGDAYYYTGASAIIRSWGAANGCPSGGATAVPFHTGTIQAECRTYCGADEHGWSGGSPRAGWPNVLDCRAPMGHTYDLGWTWKLTLDFFDAHSR